MRAVALHNQWITPEDYLTGELVSDIRHEYACGQVYAMAGSSAAHHHITGNLYSELNLHLRRKPCEAFMADMKVRMESGGESYIYYPDLMVACDPSDDADYFRRFPKVIVEVLSPSTQRIDSSEKLRAYQSIPSLEVYILISQTEAAVTLFRRVNQWQREVVAGAGTSLEISELDFSIPFGRLYERTGLA